MMLPSQKFRFCNRQSFTTKLFVTFLGLLIAQHVLAQVTDSFADGDFTNAPEWSGNQTSFTVENGMLRLNAAPVSATAFLSTSSHAIENASWECVVRMDFNPSSTNRSQIFLVSDSHDLTGSLNGYFVMVGDTPDEISLYRQSGTVKTKIIDGVDARLNLSVVNVKIKVTRDDQGQWELFSDAGLTGSYLSEGTVKDETHTRSSWFGFLCTYTSTRSDDFYFDDFVVTGSPVTDVVPPAIEQLNIVSSQSLELFFSEPLNRTEAENVNNYVLWPASVHPVTAKLADEERTVVLSFDERFQNARESKVIVSHIDDVAGNKMAVTEKAFFYFEPVTAAWKDIIITEIFPDPDPSQGLPLAEFIELFNRSEKTFDLSKWSITDGNSVAVFPKMYLFPGEYLIVTPANELKSFAAFGNVVGVSNFPSLNNSGDVIIFRDASGAMIDAVQYSDRWYHDDNKRSGGWTLELIDVDNICSESGNWIASDDKTGGTPGQQNSVYANKPDLTGPSLVSVIPLNASTLSVRFSEKLENVPPSKQQFVILPAVDIGDVVFTDSLLTSVTIILNTPIDGTRTYSLSARDIYDCAGNLIHEGFNTIQFGLPQSPQRNDILINEVLFNPTSTGVDFVELYNASQKFINAKSLRLVNGSGSAASLSLEDRLIAPRQYVAATTSRDATIGEYPASFESTFFETASLPSMNDDEGIIKVVHDNSAIDSLYYSKSMHSPFLKDKEGVSLERISFSEPTNLAANWKSAASSAGFATPGFLNSNARPEFSGDEEITLEPEAFSPFDSPRDFVMIHYNFSTGGKVGNIDILDSYGRHVYTLGNNEILGTTGFFRWDGNDVNGHKVRVGYYMVRFEVFDATGVVRVFRKRLAVASRF